MVYAIIFAGGVGTRMGSDIPKQFLEINKKPILMHTIEVFSQCNLVNNILVVSKKEYIDIAKDLIHKYNLCKVIDVISGGTTAFESQRIGVNYINQISNNYDDIVIVHDGVRPFVNDELIEKCINGAKEKGSAVTVSPAFETIAIINGNNEITQTVPRQNCLIARAPQAFYFKDLYEAHQRAIKENKEYIDSASMMLDQGKSLNPILGPNGNIKITTQYDYLIAKLLFKENK